MTSMRAVIFKLAAWIGMIVLVAGGGLLATAAPKALPVGNFSDEIGDSGFDNLDIVDPGLNGKVGVLRVGSEVGANKLLTVFVGLKNKTARRLNLQLETIYKDKEGNALNSGSWIPFTLDASAEKEYHSSAITEAAVDFLVRVRRAPANSSSKR